MLLPWSHRDPARSHPQRADRDANSLPDVLPHTHAIDHTDRDFYSDSHQHHDGNTQYDPDQHANRHSHSNTDTNRLVYQPTDPDIHTHTNVYPFKYQYPSADRYSITHYDS